MYYYLTTISVICFTALFYFFYILRGYKTTATVIYSKYQKWKSLNKLVSLSVKNNNMAIITWVSMVLIFKTLYVNLIQKLNKSVKRLGKNTYEITYTLNGRIYKLLVKAKRGPAPILQISTNNDIDVTDDIMPYLGPDYTWHLHNYSANFFGYSSLTFQLSNGTEKIFTLDEPIVLNL